MSVAAATQLLNQAEASIRRGEYVVAHILFARIRLELAAASEADVRLPSIHLRWLETLIHYYKGATEAVTDELCAILTELESAPTDRRLQAEVLNTLGNIAYMRGDSTAATRYYKRGLQQAERIVSHELAVRLWSNLGNISTTEGRMHEALYRFNKAVAHAEAQNDPVILMMSYRLLYHVYIHIGPLSRAWEYAARVSELLPQVENQNFVSQALVSVGMVHRYSGDFAAAATHLQRALKLAQQCNNKIVEAYALSRLSLVYQDLGDNAACCDTAATLFADAAAPIIIKRDAATRLAECYSDSGGFARAHTYIAWLQHYEQEPGREQHERAYLTYAHYYLAQGDWQQAEQNFTLAITQSKMRSDMFELGRCYFTYAKAMLNHNPPLTDAAGAMLAAAAATFQRIGATHYLAEVNHTLAAIP